MSKNIAPLDTMSNALDTAAKFVRIMANEGVTIEQFRLPIDDQTARRNLATFFENGCRLVVKGPSSLLIERTKLPSPEKFIGKGSSIWRGPANGNGLEGEEGQDARSLTLTEVDFSKVVFAHALNEGEQYITGEEKLTRLKAGKSIRLDFGIGIALYQEKNQATLRFLHDAFGVTWMEFAGTVLRNAHGDRCFFYLRRDGDGSWDWYYDWLGTDRNRGNVSPLLAN